MKNSELSEIVTHGIVTHAYYPDRLSFQANKELIIVRFRNVPVMDKCIKESCAQNSQCVNNWCNI